METEIHILFSLLLINRILLLFLVKSVIWLLVQNVGLVIYVYVETHVILRRCNLAVKPRLSDQGRLAK